MEMLDAGFRSGGTVMKMVPVKDKGWRKELYPVYAPYTLAGIRKDSLSETALDRSFLIEMKRKPLWVLKASYNPAKFDSSVRDDLNVWALQHAQQVASLYESDELEEQIRQLALNDRATDIWRPLFAVLLALGFDQKSQEWQDLSTLAQEMHRDPEVIEMERQILIVQALQQRVDSNGTGTEITTELVAYLQEQGIKVNPKDFKELMDQWGFEQRKIRLNGKPRRAWELSELRLRELEQQLTESTPIPLNQ